MNYYPEKLDSLDDVLSLCAELKQQETKLDDTLTQISHLKRGNVKVKDTKKRSSFASQISAKIQQIGNFIYLKKLSLKKETKEDLKRIGYKADKVLRENIVLQTNSPIDVVRFSDIPIRHSYSSFGDREKRWGYGLHKKPFTEDGLSITLANMPPNYTQSFHNHTLSEYCLILDSKTEGIYHPGRKKERKRIALKNQILHFSATTPHTLNNPLDTYSRNMTFKKPTGLLDWRPVSNLNKVKIVRTRILKGKSERVDKNITRRVFQIHDKHYNYNLYIHKLDKNISRKYTHKNDKYIFIISGNVDFTHKNIRLNCKKNDFVVIDKNTPYSIHTNTTSRMYTVDPKMMKVKKS